MGREHDVFWCGRIPSKYKLEPPRTTTSFFESSADTPRDRVDLLRPEGRTRGSSMQDRTLYSIQESRRLLGGISRNMIYQLLRTGRLASVVIGSRRFISAEAIADLIERSTTTVSPSLRATRRSAAPEQITLPLRLPSSVRARVGAGQAVKSPDLAR